MKLATLCYVMHENKTLMLYRNKKENDYHEGKWNGLGGKFEEGETPEECAIREVLEESGLIVKDPQLKGFITFPKFDGIDDWYVFVLVFNGYEGKMIDSPEGKLEWIPNDKLTELNLWDGDKIFLEWLFQDKFFSSKFNYDDGKFVDYKVNFY
ncbi:MAG: 8-oxo-dGTP diphosphatase [Melioribacteraceae bacterium]|nr:8-oxo-dGTP diphosphatase [Melioribacteraceae bacterium]MCF8355285.1 8-oxo-dGTP diphosphatase [Melioribacteraceae bacterium]MCF8394131.1 8-oxo-dGTP diphosphatase [Melioribacteraceae bacterium]MCF8418130.1 8-oxo-dGTP diphosphatase [Melioribacteraceae bacterium]